MRGAVFFISLGEGEDPRRLVPYLHSKLAKAEIAELTSGKQIRDFLDVAEAGRMIAQVVLGNQLGPVNICSGIPTTVRQLAERVADEYGRRDLLVLEQGQTIWWIRHVSSEFLIFI